MAKKILMIAPNFYGIDQSIRNSLASFGFDVILENTRNKLELPEALAMKISKKTPFAEKMLTPVFKYYLDRDNKKYLSVVSELRPDALFVIKGETIYPETLAVIKNEMKIPCFIYQWDCPFYSYGGHVADIYRKRNFADGLHFYDHIFSHDPYYVHEIKARGAHSVSYLPLATDPGQYKDIEVSAEERDKFGYDICFVGSPIANRIDVLESLRGFKLGVFGDGWEMWHRLRLKKLPGYYKGRASGEKVLKIYKSSKIVLNIHGPEAKEGVNTRTFDIPACGSFELVDYRPEIDNLLIPGKEIVYYKDIDELKKLVEFYLDNPEKRRSIVENGRARVFNSHTWSHRMREVASFIDNSL